MSTVMTAPISKKRIREIEKAYAEMQKRGWGFSSNGNGFGDPKATITVIGPYDGVLVNALAMDPDPVKAVKKAIEKVNGLGL